MSKPIEIIETVSGNFKSGGALHGAIESAVGGALRRAALRIVAAEMDKTPVVSGNLRRGWAAGEPEWEGETIKIKVGNAVVYAKRVNATSARAKGFVEEAFNEAREEAVNIIKDGVRELKGQLWEKK
jgi:hypothetical protein